MGQIKHENCPNIECYNTTNKRDSMRKHFRTRHPQEFITIQQQGLLPQCNNCVIFQKNAHSDLHSNSKECKHYANTNRKRKQELI
jgi:hypothetical protein